MKQIIIVFLLIGTSVIFIGYRFYNRSQHTFFISPISDVIDRPLDKYTIDNLTKRQAVVSQIVLDEPVATTSSYTASLFHFMSEKKKVTGLIHVPQDASVDNKKPVIVQLRGYVDKSVYTRGIGTRRSAEVYARNGYISIAPDFLGYGGSDDPSGDVFEERFQTITTILDLLSSLQTLPIADSSKIGIWAHSNGGHIALTVLTITKGKYPTTLWAPVTKAFPYSILYYTDEAEDKGKALRKKLAAFEKMYDVDAYTMVNYIDRIQAPLLLHQGTKDDAVPVLWSDAFVSEVKKNKGVITYHQYGGADHNLQPSWNLVVARDIDFFRQYLR